MAMFKRLIKWGRCFFSHRWLCGSPRPVKGKWNRECQVCGRREHATYDMSYGDTLWHFGWDFTA